MCDYYTSSGKCCNDANSYGAVELFRSAVTADATEDAGGSGAYTVDLRIRLDYYDTDALAWRPLVWHNLREWHARTLHVMLVAADLSGVYHWHAARDATYPSDDVFSVAGAALARAGEYHALLSFLVEGEEVDVCVLEAAAHVHWTGGALLDDGGWNSVGVEVASRATVFVPGRAPAPAAGPWNVGAARAVAGVALNAAGSYDGEVSRAEQDAACGAWLAELELSPVASLAEQAQLTFFEPSAAGGDGAAALPALELAAPGCAVLAWRVARAGVDGASGLRPFLGAPAHVFVARYGGGALDHFHAQTPDAFAADATYACANHMHAASAPAAFGPLFVGAYEFPTAGVYLVAAFVGAPDDELVAVAHTVVVGGEGGACALAAASGASEERCEKCAGRLERRWRAVDADACLGAQAYAVDAGGQCDLPTVSPTLSPWPTVTAPPSQRPTLSPRPTAAGGGGAAAADDASLVLVGLLTAAGVLLCVSAVFNLVLARLVRKSRRRLISADSTFQSAPPTTVALAVMTPQNAKIAT